SQRAQRVDLRRVLVDPRGQQPQHRPLHAVMAARERERSQRSELRLQLASQGVVFFAALRSEEVVKTVDVFHGRVASHRGRVAGNGISRARTCQTSLALSLDVDTGVRGWAPPDEVRDRTARTRRTGSMTRVLRGPRGSSDRVAKCGHLAGTGLRQAGATLLGSNSHPDASITKGGCS